MIRGRRWFRHVASVLWVLALPLSSQAQATKPSSLQQAMKYAPEGAVGVIHVEPQALAKELLAALAKEPEFKHWDANTLAAVARFAQKIESLDVFLFGGPLGGVDMPLPFLVIHGPLRAGDVNDLVRALEGVEGDFLLKKGDQKGHYEFNSDKMPLEVVLGGEANELPPGVVIVGVAQVVAPKTMPALGTAKHEDLGKLLKDVDAAAPVWGAVLVTKMDSMGDAFLWIAGSAYPTGGGPSKVAMEFKDANAARERLSELEEEVKGGKGWAKFLTSIGQLTREGSRLTLASKTKDSLVPAIVASLVESIQSEKRDQSMMILREIGSAAIVYSADHDDLLPSDLPALVKEKAIPAQALASPVTGRVVKVDEKGLPQDAFEPDYVLVKYPMSLLKIKEPKEKVLAYERPENFKGAGTIVLYVDGHVAWLSMEAFQKQLKASQDWIAAQEKKGK